MTFTVDQKAALAAPLDRSAIKSRSRAGRSLSYIEGWWAIAEANRIFGFDCWSRETLEMKCLHEPYQNDKGNWVVSYSARVRVRVWTTGDTCARDGSGFGSGFDKEVGSAHESAIKEAETDAMKRALMTFGNQFGLALYDKTQENVTDGIKGNTPYSDITKTVLAAATDQEGTSKATKENWRGPLLVTKLKSQLRAMAKDLSLCDEDATVDSVALTYSAELQQARFDLPDWFDAAMEGLSTAKTRIAQQQLAGAV